MMIRAISSDAYSYILMQLLSRTLHLPSRTSSARFRTLPMSRVVLTRSSWQNRFQLEIDIVMGLDSWMSSQTRS